MDELELAASRLLTEAITAATVTGRSAVTVHRIHALAAQPALPGWRRATERLLLTRLRAAVSDAWQRGWQPADLDRLCRRRLEPLETALLGDTIAAELAGYAAVTVDPCWTGQLAAIGARTWWPADSHHLTARAQTLGPGADGWSAVVGGAVLLLALLGGLPRIERLGPRPGEATAGTAARAGRPAIDEKILARVRALLAKAESTTFPAEAETFTAGAQALIARHSIDHALLAAEVRRPDDAPAGRRLGIDNPYEGPKASLLSAVGTANGCRVVWSKQLGFCTVVGFDPDLDAVELLFTSLLLQATRAMTQAGSRPTGRGSRTRAFRHSFLTAFATRIGERLAGTSRQQAQDAAAAPGGSDLLPVLADREQAVQEALRDWFPTVLSRPISVSDAEGWERGRQAADRATLRTASELAG